MVARHNANDPDTASHPTPRGFQKPLPLAVSDGQLARRPGGHAIALSSSALSSNGLLRPQALDRGPHYFRPGNDTVTALRLRWGWQRAAHPDSKRGEP